LHESDNGRYEAGHRAGMLDSALRAHAPFAQNQGSGEFRRIGFLCPFVSSFAESQH
jgi:hypothetical protein